MTHGEMINLLKEASKQHPWLEKALKEHTLKLAATGQASPCLDLSRISQDLINLVLQMGTDLVIIEGMKNIELLFSFMHRILILYDSYYFIERHGPSHPYKSVFKNEIGSH